MSMRVAVGSDHAGFDLKEVLRAELAALGHDVSDLGTHDGTTSVDYPDYGAAVGRAVANGRADLGVCVCGSGNGIAMAANKVPGIRAAVVHDVTTASLAGKHNHANVVCFGARTTGATVVIDALGAFLQATDAPLAAPEDDRRHQRRIEKLTALDGLDGLHDRELVHLTAPEGTS
jgi:ribose 5-phosphate isomerase B